MKPKSIMTSERDVGSESKIVLYALSKYINI